MQLLWQSVSLILSFAFVFIWQVTPLSDYTIQVFGVLIAAFLLIALFKRGLNPFDTAGPASSASDRPSRDGPTSLGGKNEPFSIGILTAIMLLMVFATGGLNSALFFLLYFLIFGIAFVFEPLTVFVFVIGIIAVFLPYELKDNVMANLLRIGSILLISPLAYFFGREYRDREKEEQKTQDAAQAIAKDIEEIVENEEELLDDRDMEKVKDILEKTDKLQQ